MNFPYHTESVSQLGDHFKQRKKKLKKNVAEKLIIFREGGRGGYPFAENSSKIINLIFATFPYRLADSYHIRTLTSRNRPRPTGKLSVSTKSNKLGQSRSQGPVVEFQKMYTDLYYLD